MDSSESCLFGRNSDRSGVHVFVKLSFFGMCYKSCVLQQTLLTRSQPGCRTFGLLALSLTIAEIFKMIINWGIINWGP